MRIAPGSAHSTPIRTAVRLLQGRSKPRTCNRFRESGKLSPTTKATRMRCQTRGARYQHLFADIHTPVRSKRRVGLRFTFDSLFRQRRQPPLVHIRQLTGSGTAQICCPFWDMTTVLVLLPIGAPLHPLLLTFLFLFISCVSARRGTSAAVERHR